MTDPVATIVDWRDRVTAAAVAAEADPYAPRSVAVDLDALAELVWAADYFHTCYVEVRSDLVVARAQAGRPS